MIIQQVHYRPTYWQDRYRGQDALILGVKFVQSTRDDAWVLCYHIRFIDGEEQYRSVADRQEYQLIAAGEPQP